MITVATLNGCATVIYKQARSQEVRRGGGGGESINTSESIGPNTRAGGGGGGGGAKYEKRDTFGPDAFL